MRWDCLIGCELALAEALGALIMSLRNDEDEVEVEDYCDENEV